VNRSFSKTKDEGLDVCLGDCDYLKNHPLSEENFCKKYKKKINVISNTRDGFCGIREKVIIKLRLKDCIKEPK
jgi:hypothetical protein